MLKPQKYGKQWKLYTGLDFRIKSVDFQCSFRHQQALLDHFVRLETYIRDAFVSRKHVVTIFFDLEKAYDTTWKFGIMKDLNDLGLR